MKYGLIFTGVAIAVLMILSIVAIGHYKKRGQLLQGGKQITSNELQDSIDHDASLECDKEIQRSLESLERLFINSELDNKPMVHSSEWDDLKWDNDGLDKQVSKIYPSLLTIKQYIHNSSCSILEEEALRKTVLNEQDIPMITKIISSKVANNFAGYKKISAEDRSSLTDVVFGAMILHSIVKTNSISITETNSEHINQYCENMPLIFNSLAGPLYENVYIPAALAIMQGISDKKEWHKLQNNGFHHQECGVLFDILKKIDDTLLSTPSTYMLEGSCEKFQQKSEITS